MSDFDRTLKFVNLDATVEKKFGSVTLWRAKPILGLVTSGSRVLEIAPRSTTEQLESAIRHKGPRIDLAVFHSDHDLKRFTELMTDQNVSQVLLENDILFDAARKLLGVGSRLDLPRATIEPALFDTSDETIDLCTRKIASWIRNADGNPMAVLSGPAGFGKTTICKILVNRILDVPSLKRIPLYISSTNWQNLVEQHHVTLRAVFLEAVSTTFSKAAIGEEMVEHLIAQGAIVPVFDGLDEICSDAYTEVGIREIVDQLDELFAESPNARVLFTTRNTFWSTAEPSDRLKFHEFTVQPFDLSQREAFLSEWFDEDTEAKQKAVSLLGRIEALGNSSGKGRSRDVVSFSESPYV